MLIRVKLVSVGVPRRLIVQRQILPVIVDLPSSNGLSIPYLGRVSSTVDDHVAGHWKGNTCQCPMAIE